MQTSKHRQPQTGILNGTLVVQSTVCIFLACCVHDLRQKDKDRLSMLILPMTDCQTSHEYSRQSRALKSSVCSLTFSMNEKYVSLSLFSISSLLNVKFRHREREREREESLVTILKNGNNYGAHYCGNNINDPLSH